MDVRWITAFLDFDPADHERGTAFWSAVTGYAVSEPRGSHREFTTLVPPDGDSYLKVQRLEEGPSRVHLDLHVDDPRRHADRAVSRGAVETHAEDDFITLRSPAGLVFCFVDHAASTPPAPSRTSEGITSMADQLSVDIPAARWEGEREFWGGTFGVPIEYAGGTYAHIQVDSLPMRVILQRLDDNPPAARAHLDIDTNDRDAETARHEGLGATVVERGSDWTVLTDPTGLPYCIC